MSDGKSPERLWTPWRMEYILDNSKTGGCIFCDKPGEERDRENLILKRGKESFVIMNKYPYNNGHLMITPYAHESDLTRLEGKAMAEMMNEMQRTLSILKEVMNPDGFNVGMNLGKAAGAGIDEHLHLHIVPRWNGDTNFMPVMANTRVMPEYLDETYMRLKPFYKEES